LASATAGNPQSWNRYAYTLNNPLVFVDPTGMMTNQNFYADNSDFMVDVQAPTYINGQTFIVISASAADAGLSAGLVGGGMHESAHGLGLESQDTVDFTQGLVQVVIWSKPTKGLKELNPVYRFGHVSFVIGDQMYSWQAHIDSTTGQEDWFIALRVSIFVKNKKTALRAWATQ
jgi:hypothetical protein